MKVVLGDTIGHFVKEDINYKLTDPFKKIVAPICTGNYIEQTLDDVIALMKVDDVTAKLLRKKLKGNQEKDTLLLESAGVADVEYWAFFIAEAIAYEKIVKLLEVAGYEEGSPEFEKAINDIKLALIVEEGLKIGVEYEE